jgi:hypothetical protein
VVATLNDDPIRQPQSYRTGKLQTVQCCRYAAMSCLTCFNGQADRLVIDNYVRSACRLSLDPEGAAVTERAKADGTT